MLVIVLPVDGDGTRVDGRGRPALMRLLPPLSLAYSLLHDPTPGCPLQEENEVGPAGLELGQNFRKFL